jgi:DNA polymerase-3 subunit gamma/tau
VTSKPAFSPFEQSRKRFDEPVPEAAVKVAVAAVVTPIAVKVQVMETPKVVAPVSEAVVETAPAEQAAAQAPAVMARTEAQPAGELQKAAVEALQSTPRQQTAADAFDDAEWTIEGGELRVQMMVSKTMLPMVVNADADKIVRAALREKGAGALKLVLLPGNETTAAAAKKPRAAKAGSAADLAAKHPVVQQAQKLFNAEIRNVIDLRDSE